MKNRNWRSRFQNFMQGRYGEDALSRFLLIVTLILLIVNFFVPTPVFGILGVLLLIWVYYRMFSKNTARRAQENRKYLEIKERIASFFRRGGGRQQAQSPYRIYRCPKCGQKIRIPKGHGMVEITCPKCRTRFRKRT